MKVKQNIQVLIKMIGIVVISSIVLVGLLCLVYKLPRNRMVEHVIESDNTIRLQNDDYNMSISNFYDTYDTDTNIIMLLESHRISTVHCRMPCCVRPGHIWKISGEIGRIP